MHRLLSLLSLLPGLLRLLTGLSQIQGLLTQPSGCVLKLLLQLPRLPGELLLLCLLCGLTLSGVLAGLLQLLRCLGLTLG